MGVEGLDKESCGLQVARVLVGNRQRQEQMRGFFPFTTLRVRMTNKNRMTNKTSNGKSKSKMRGSLRFGRDGRI